MQDVGAECDKLSDSEIKKQWEGLTKSEKNEYQEVVDRIKKSPLKGTDWTKFSGI